MKRRMDHVAKRFGDVAFGIGVGIFLISLCRLRVTDFEIEGAMILFVGIAMVIWVSVGPGDEGRGR
jgi:hypothetical protein